MARCELLGSKRPLIRKRFLGWFLHERKCLRVGGFVEHSRLGVLEFLVLLMTCQRHVRSQEAVHQFAFLLLREDGGRAGDQESDGNDDPHVLERAERWPRL
jgi:hypothetical protein